MSFPKIIIKRSGKHEKFSAKKISSAVSKAFKACKKKTPQDVIDKIFDLLSNDENEKEVLTVDEIHELVEYVLREYDEDVSKSYNANRNKHEFTRDFVNKKIEFINKYKGTKNTADATIDDNSNVGGKNIGILNAEIHKEDNIEVSRGMVMGKLSELYPDFDPKQYVYDLESHIMYKHDESSFAGAIAPYCVSMSMYPFLTNGIKEIGGLSARPENLDSFCGMYVNLIFATSAMFAGAVATSEALLYFDYFARKEWEDNYYKESDSFYKIGYKLRKLLNASHYWTNSITELEEHDFGSEELNLLRDDIVFNSKRPLTEEELNLWRENVKENPDFSVKVGDGTRTIRSQIHQYFQQIIYSINQPAAARGLQSAFVNFSYFDKPFFEGMFGEFYFPDGTQPKWESLCWLQKEFMRWFNKERSRCLLTFPVESFALVYKNGKFLDEESADFVEEEYARGHSFFTYISDTVDSLSSCCRLKNKVQTKEFNFTNGNMGVQTGSKSVITLNLNRLIQNWYRSNNDSKENFEESFKVYLKPILDRVYMYHIAYNELLWDMYNSNLLPVYKAGFIDLDKQYLTIGLNGLNQAAEFLGFTCNDNLEYSKFCQFIFGTIKESNQNANGKYFGHKVTLNTECVPAESLAIKNYNWDKEDGYWVPEDTNLYASYIYKPNDKKISVLEKLKLHGNNYIGDFLDGGSASHINLDHHLSKEQYKKLLSYSAEVGCQYLTWNVINSECEDCGYISKEPLEVCPICGSTHFNYYDRIIGYLTKIKNWSEGRQIEQKTRVYSNNPESPELC